ncbi:4-hydroxy-3-methylbut-2-enyl diphosphate reductase [Nitratiruptor sp. SB155-2]|uniref:4-hydroxy-3-methylbut-2-enyl diphosphate reductase n=1 Tax=Nitratiruptor sp. (strain SB155-2) TaxID=387092 RepID=ISPH_NITSB|nr:4-hydroxy-3-methylbut-2-enyl diphosphate reductase [Nitratiruptor sp. SB155-2]A6Q2R7.1 RecName: Full=4-hydroxy-3-methylbut-2-enyl diphosphate reductase; Short=HMBPP reductase [Nitratiruptor sp. SB155-2]BAF69776.1 4-hydroxy-3-methylbut-2-enyl diphosphate reductase [Nitratiruptor sp. SB155-2]
MEIRLAKSYGFCFGVKRAIKIAEESPNSVTFGPLIHNKNEIDRLKEKYNVELVEEIDEIQENSRVVIRTHGIPKEKLALLKEKNVEVIDATCPFVTKPQEIVSKMSEEGYSIVIFGDINHPEIKGVMSYATDPIVVLSVEELEGKPLKEKVATVAQTTRKFEEYQKIVNYLMEHKKEVRVFNTICNATFENQDAARELSREADIMIIIGGKNSSNTKQLFKICKENCPDSYLVENAKELEKEWFEGKKVCGITAGASTPNWIIEEVIENIKKIQV